MQMSVCLMVGRHFVIFQLMKLIELIKVEVDKVDESM